jgi:hypothetical protein
MPLARITTRSPEHTSALSQQLQLEGYSVEVVSPGEVYAQPADLEIDFALSDPAEALLHAGRHATELGADVVVASGVLELLMQPTPVAPVELQPAEVLGIPKQPQAHAIPVEAMPAETIPAEPVVMQQTAEEEVSHELPPYNEHFARNLGTQLREALALLGMAAEDLRKRLAGHLRAAVASTRSSIATLAHAHQERMKQKIAAKQAEREQREQQAQPSGRADVDLPAQQPQPEVVAATTVQSPSPAIPALAAPLPPAARMARKRRAPLQLRGIFTGAAAASILFIVGMVLANVHQQSPLPASMTTPVEQHVPFGAIIVQGKPAQSKVTVAQPKVTQPNTVQPNIVTPAPQTQPRESSQTTARSKPHPYQRRAAHNSDDDVTVDDVTVRHFPAPTRRPIQQQAKFKRYSDLE